MQQLLVVIGPGKKFSQYLLSSQRADNLASMVRENGLQSSTIECDLKHVEHKPNCVYITMSRPLRRAEAQQVHRLIESIAVA